MEEAARPRFGGGGRNVAQETNNRNGVVGLAVDILLALQRGDNVSLQDLALEMESSVNTVRRYVYAFSRRMNIRVERGIVIVQDGSPSGPPKKLHTP